MPSTKTQPARGMRDFLPEDVRKREYVIGVIKDVYERYGFEPLETPAAENIETLMGKYGEEGNQLIYKILKRGVHEGTGEADLALRYDLTVPLARVVAEYRDKLPKFFKRYQIQPVWRADRPARGRYREFYQCDVDVLGSRSMIVEAEICAAVGDILETLQFENFTIRMNHRKVLSGLLEGFGIPFDRQLNALVTLDKWEKIGSGAVEVELQKHGYSLDETTNLVTFFGKLTDRKVRSDRITVYDWDLFSEVRNQYNIETLTHLYQFPSEDEEFFKGVQELATILSLGQSPAKPRIEIDLSLVRGLSYYTGSIMEIGVPDLGGSLGGGGRYDNLVGMFLGQEVPACGFSLGLERMIVVMNERGMFPQELVSSPADVMVTIWPYKDAEQKLTATKDSLAVARILRNSGLRVDVYPVRNAKLGTQLTYAAKRGFPFVIVIGEEERTRGHVVLRNMKTGEQQAMSPHEVVSLVRGK